MNVKFLQIYHNMQQKKIKLKKVGKNMLKNEERQSKKIQELGSLIALDPNDPQSLNVMKKSLSQSQKRIKYYRKENQRRNIF